MPCPSYTNHSHLKAHTTILHRRTIIISTMASGAGRSLSIVYLPSLYSMYECMRVRAICGTDDMKYYHGTQGVNNVIKFQIKLVVLSNEFNKKFTAQNIFKLTT